MNNRYITSKVENLPSCLFFPTDHSIFPCTPTRKSAFGDSCVGGLQTLAQHPWEIAADPLTIVEHRGHSGAQGMLPGIPTETRRRQGSTAFTKHGWARDWAWVPSTRCYPEAIVARKTAYSAK